MLAFEKEFEKCSYLEYTTSHFWNCSTVSIREMVRATTQLDETICSSFLITKEEKIFFRPAPNDKQIWERSYRSSPPTLLFSLFIYHGMLQLQYLTSFNGHYHSFALRFSLLHSVPPHLKWTAPPRGHLPLCISVSTERGLGDLLEINYELKVWIIWITRDEVLIATWIDKSASLGKNPVILLQKLANFLFSSFVIQAKTNHWLRKHTKFLKKNQKKNFISWTMIV